MGRLFLSGQLQVVLSNPQGTDYIQHFPCRQMDRLMI